VALGAGLHDHYAHVVGHEVVQLAGDAGALLGHRLVCSQVLLAFQQLGPRRQRLRAQLPVTHGATGDQHRRDGHNGDLHQVLRAPFRAELRHCARCDEDPAASYEPPSRAPHRERIPVAEERDADWDVRLRRTLFISRMADLASPKIGPATGMKSPVVRRNCALPIRTVPGVNQPPYTKGASR